MKLDAQRPLTSATNGTEARTEEISAQTGPIRDDGPLGPDVRPPVEVSEPLPTSATAKRSRIASAALEPIERGLTSAAQSFPNASRVAGQIAEQYGRKTARVLRNAKHTTLDDFVRLAKAPAELVDSFVPPKLSDTDRASLLASTNDAVAALTSAIEVRKAVNDAPPVDAIASIRAWVDGMAKKQAKEPLTVVEHSAVLFLARWGVLEGHPEATDLEQTVQTMLAKSWTQLSGTPHDPAEPFRRLPGNVLRKAGAEARSFHACAFQDVRRGRAAALENLAPGEDFVLGHRHLGSLSMLALAFAKTGAPGLAALALGWAAWSVSESNLHQFIYHATDRLIAKYEDALPELLSHPMERGARHHRYHHGMTYRRGQFADQFGSPEDKARLDAKIAERESPLAQKALEDSSYGLKLPPREMFFWWVAQSPLFVGLSAAAEVASRASGGGGPGVAFHSIFWLTSLLMPGGPALLHPKMHGRANEVIEDAPAFLRPLLKSEWMAKMSQIHAIHHAVKGTTAGGNYNLVAPTWADVLKGQHTKPNLELLIELRDKGYMGGVFFDR